MFRGIVRSMMISVLIMVFLSSVGHVALSADKITIKYGHVDPLTSVHGVAATKLKELLNKYTNGKAELSIFPNSVLGGEQETLRLVQDGSLEMSDGAVNNLTPLAPSVGFCTFPFMFENREQSYAVLDGPVGVELREKVLKEARVRILAWIEGGFRYVTNSKRPIQTMEDLKGVKLRIPRNPIMLDVWGAWGALTVPMAWPEVFTAMQQKVIDGQENPYWVAYVNKFYEVQKYLSEIPYIIWLGPMVINEKIYQSYPPDIRAALDKAAVEAANHAREHMYTYNQDCKKKLKELGMQIIDWKDVPNHDAWITKSKAIWPKYYESVGGQEMVDKVEAFKASAK